jgi:hypothetical protein
MVEIKSTSRLVWHTARLVPHAMRLHMHVLISLIHTQSLNSMATSMQIGVYVQVTSRRISVVLLTLPSVIHLALAIAQNSVEDMTRIIRLGP